MASIYPFITLLPSASLAARFTCPPYDVVSTSQVRVVAKENPHSFIRVVRAEVDFPEGTDPYDQSVYIRARENLVRVVQEDWMYRTAHPRLFIYRLFMKDHAQTGMVACCSVDDYDHGSIRRHEKTRPDKETDRTRHMLALRAHPDPVFLAYPGCGEIDELVEAELGKAPLLDFISEDEVQVHHTVWEVYDIEGIRTAFERVPCLYIADGHHRSASASRARQELAAGNAQPTGSEGFNFFPAVIFPAEQLRILPYNRVMRNLSDWHPQRFIQRLRSEFCCWPNAAESPVKGNVSIYLSGKWYGVTLCPSSSSDPVARLDLTRLHQQIVEPYFGIIDQRIDHRIGFVGGIDSTNKLMEWVDTGRAQVAFSLAPPKMDDLLTVADQNRLMPPKSTWFEPKLRSGLFVHPFDL